MKKLRVNNKYGEFYYTGRTEYNDGWLTKIYNLYDSNKNYISEFWGYSEMLEYVKNGCKHL